MIMWGDEVKTYLQKKVKTKLKNDGMTQITTVPCHLTHKCVRARTMTHFPRLTNEKIAVNMCMDMHARTHEWFTSHDWRGERRTARARAAYWVSQQAHAHTSARVQWTQPFIIVLLVVLLLQQQQMANAETNERTHTRTEGHIRRQK